MSKVIYEKRKRVAYVTLNRPQQKNAIDREMHELLVKVWKDFCDDESVDAAILTGAGDAFCAGMDLKTFVPEYVGAKADQIRKLLPLGLGGITWGDKLREPLSTPRRSTVRDQIRAMGMNEGQTRDAIQDFERAGSGSV